MKLPYSQNAVIAPEKLIDYLLNVQHKRDGSKARLLLLLGYRLEVPMNFELYSEVVVQRDIPQEGLLAGDVGVVVERHDIVEHEPGYSVEFFDMLGNTVAVATLPASVLRAPMQTDRPAVRSELVAA